jgi:hypothetical protein
MLITKGYYLFATKSIWGDWYRSFQRGRRESARESAIYDQLKKGPIFQETVKHIVLSKLLVEETRQLIAPAEECPLYPLLSESTELERQV